MGKKRTELFVREVTENDKVGYLKISRSEDVGEYVKYMSANSLEEASDFIERCIQAHYTTLYGIFQAKSNRLIGVMEASLYPEDNYATVSYFVGKKYRGHEYVEEAIRSLSTILGKELRFEVHQSNSSSHRVQQKLHSHILKVRGSYFTYCYIG